MTEDRTHTDEMYDRAEQWYAERIRSVVEIPDNIGKIIAVGQERLLRATMLEGYELCLSYAANTLTIEDA